MLDLVAPGAVTAALLMSNGNACGEQQLLIIPIPSFMCVVDV